MACTATNTSVHLSPCTGVVFLAAFWYSTFAGQELSLPEVSALIWRPKSKASLGIGTVSSVSRSGLPPSLHPPPSDRHFLFVCSAFFILRFSLPFPPSTFPVPDRRFGRLENYYRPLLTIPLLALAILPPAKSAISSILLIILGRQLTIIDCQPPDHFVALCIVVLTVLCLVPDFPRLADSLGSSRGYTPGWMNQLVVDHITATCVSSYTASTCSLATSLPITPAEHHGHESKR